MMYGSVWNADECGRPKVSQPEDSPRAVHHHGAQPLQGSQRLSLDHCIHSSLHPGRPRHGALCVGCCCLAQDQFCTRTTISVSTSGWDSGLGDKANSPSVSEQPMKSRVRRLIRSSLRQRRPAPGCSIFAQRVGAEQVRGKLNWTRLHWYAASPVTSRRC
jgi:hypothetical protein